MTTTVATPNLTPGKISNNDNDSAEKRGVHKLCNNGITRFQHPETQTLHNTLYFTRVIRPTVTPRMR